MARATLACLALAALSLLLPTTPTYDPYAWLIWGREVLQLDLSTVGGPSWKPLPLLVTVPGAVVDSASPTLWVWVARAGMLLALVLAFRVARRLGGGVVGGVVAATTLALATDVLRFSALGDSEGLLIAALLGAVELHLDGRRRAALALCVAAALLRPESWAFVGLYALWLAREDPRLRLPVAGLAVAVLALWFVPEWIGSGDPLRAGARARDPNPNALTFADFPALRVAERFVEVQVLPALVGLALVLAGTLVRPWRVLRGEPWAGILAVAALAWVVEVAIMTEAGFSGNLRYLIAPIALASVAAGVGLGRATTLLGERPRARAAPAALAPAAVLAALAAFAVAPIGHLRADARSVQHEARLYDELDVAIERAGGIEEFDRCRAVTTGNFQVAPLAWRLERHFEEVDIDVQPGPGSVLRSAPPPRPTPGAPVVRIATPGFRPVARAGSWQVLRRC